MTDYTYDPMGNFTLCDDANKNQRNLKAELEELETIKKERDALNQTVIEMRKEIEDMKIQLSDKKEQDEKEFNSKAIKVKDNPVVKNANARVRMEMNRILHRICMDDVTYQGAYHAYKQSVEDAYEQGK